MPTTRTVTTKMGKRCVEIIEEVAKALGFPNRSMLIRAAINAYLAFLDSGECPSGVDERARSVISDEDIVEVIMCAFMYDSQPRILVTFKLDNDTLGVIRSIDGNVSRFVRKAIAHFIVRVARGVCVDVTPELILRVAAGSRIA